MQAEYLHLGVAETVVDVFKSISLLLSLQKDPKTLSTSVNKSGTEEPIASYGSCVAEPHVVVEEWISPLCAQCFSLATCIRGIFKRLCTCNKVGATQGKRLELRRVCNIQSRDLADLIPSRRQG